MQRVTVAEDFVGYPIVYADRVHDILTICLKADVKSLPPCSKLYLPGKLALALSNVSFALVSATLDILVPYPAARADIGDLFFFRQVLLCNGGIEPAAVVAHREVWKHFDILVLSHKLSYFLTQLATVLQYDVDLLDKNSLPVRFSAALEAVLDPHLVECVQKEATHVRAVGSMTAAKRVRDV